MKRTGRAVSPSNYTFCTIETCTFARQLAGPPVVVEDREDPATIDSVLEEQRARDSGGRQRSHSDQIQNYLRTQVASFIRLRLKHRLFVLFEFIRRTRGRILYIGRLESQQQINITLATIRFSSNRWKDKRGRNKGQGTRRCIGWHIRL